VELFSLSAHRPVPGWALAAARPIKESVLIQATYLFFSSFSLSTPLRGKIMLQTLRPSHSPLWRKARSTRPRHPRRKPTIRRPPATTTFYRTPPAGGPQEGKQGYSPGLQTNAGFLPETTPFSNLRSSLGYNHLTQHAPRPPQMAPTPPSTVVASSDC